MDLDEWEQRVARFWEDFAAAPDDDGVQHVLRLDAIADECPADDGRAAFEKACVRDSTGRADQAVGWYRAGLDAGLDEERLARTHVQMATSRRVLGDVDGALELLDRTDPHALGGAPSVVKALALHDVGRDPEAVRLLIEAMVPHLPRYQRSMANYARLVTEG